MQPIGQLDQYHANVIDHGEHHLAQVLGLRLLARREIDFADLGDALHDVRTCSPNSLRMSTMVTDVSSTESCSSPAAIATGSIFISASTKSHFQGMHQIRLARGAALPFVVFQGIVVGFLDNGQIVLRTVSSIRFIKLAELGER